MSIRNIAFCTDFSDNADRAFEAALDLAIKYEAALAIVHVLPPLINPLITDIDLSMVAEDPADLKSLIQKIEEKMREVYGSRIGDRVAYELVVIDGHVSTEIISYLEKNRTDLAILGAYGTSGFDLVLFGSVSKRVAHKAPCSVMVVRKPDVKKAG